MPVRSSCLPLRRVRSSQSSARTARLMTPSNRSRTVRAMNCRRSWPRNVAAVSCNTFVTSAGNFMRASLGAPGPPRYLTSVQLAHFVAPPLEPAARASSWDLPVVARGPRSATRCSLPATGCSLATVIGSSPSFLQRRPVDARCHIHQAAPLPLASKRKASSNATRASQTSCPSASVGRGALYQGKLQIRLSSTKYSSGFLGERPKTLMTPSRFALVRPRKTSGRFDTRSRVAVPGKLMPCIAVTPAKYV